MFTFFRSLLWKKESEVEKLFRRHCEIVADVLTEFHQMIFSYLEGDKVFKDIGYRIHQKEHEADCVRRDIQLRIHQGAFLQVYREDYILLADLLDNVANKVEATSDYIVLTRPKVPEFLNREFIEMVNMTTDSFKPLQIIVNSFQTDWTKVASEAEKVRTYESTIDQIQWRMTNKLFKSQLDLAEKLHIKTLIDDVGIISNIVEDALDRLEIMLMKRRA